MMMIGVYRFENIIWGKGMESDMQLTTSKYKWSGQLHCTETYW